VSLTRTIRSCVAPPYSVRTVLMLALTALTVIIVFLNGLMAHHRIGRDTLANAQRQAESLARMLASTNTEALVLNDIGALESSLRQVGQLPGISGISVLRPDGRRLVAVTLVDGELRSSIGGSEEPPPVAADGSVAGHVLSDVYEAWARISVLPTQTLGWVRLDYSLAQRAMEQQRLAKRSVYTLLGTIAAIVILLPLILNKVLRPLHQLSDLANSLPTRLGRQADFMSHLIEVDNLGRALNKASRDVALEIARTQVILNTAAVAIISLDTQGRVIVSNPATTSIFGREECDLVGHPIGDCIPGLDADALREMFGELDSTGGRVYRIVRQDFTGRRQDGAPFPIEITLGGAPKSSGLHYVCIVRDTTDERAALETSELYERALASSHNGVFITNALMATQPIVFVNDALQKITGLAPHKIYGRGLETFLNGTGSDSGFDAIRQAIREERAESVTLHQRLPNGRELYAELSLSPVRSADGRVTNFVGIISDVTARIHAEEAIAERSTQLDAIFSLSPDGFVLFDGEGHLIFANPAFERMTGRAWKQPGLPPTLEQFEASLAALCHHDHPLPPLTDTGDGVAPWQARLVLTRPQHRVVQAQARRNVAGRSETILYFRDVTHEDEVDRMKSEFLALAAHELRTPMVSIYGFTELLLKRTFSDERRTDMLETIHRQSGLLVKMINELLDLARIESRRGMDLHITEHPVSQLVASTVRGMMRPDGERQVLVGSLPDLTVLIDGEKMQLALGNLLSNAFKYSPDGGEVMLTVHARSLDGRGYAVLEVRDQGIGMKPEQLARACERFYRADTTGNIPGTGLGLSLVKEIAELHGGRMELESEFGVGTTARLWVPLAVRSGT